MKVAAAHPKEIERVKELLSLDILDTIEEQSYNDMVQLASAICETPVALITLLDDERQWFKARVGLDAPETPKDVSFCSHAILEDDVFVVPDAMKDERFADNPLATEQPHVIFYAGMPLYSETLPMGTLCVIDHKPRQLTEEQRASLKQLARLTESLFALRKQLNDLSGVQSQQEEFISTVNHELRTPLTSLLGSITLLKNSQTGTLPNNVTKLLDIAQRNGSRLQSIINDILDVSSLSAGQIKNHLASFELVACVKQSLQMFKPMAHEASKTLTFQTDVEEAWVYADAHRINQVLQNLLSNAVKYSLEDSSITVTLSHSDEQYRVTVTNEGPGIPHDEQHKLFQRFFRSSIEHKGNPKGTGLGLYISKQLMILNDGDLDFHSEPHKQTSFWFTLPSRTPSDTPQ